jgi:PAS domain S-box-containing protein
VPAPSALRRAYIARVRVAWNELSRVIPAPVSSPAAEAWRARGLVVVRRASALAGGRSQRVGSFRLYFDDERWEWSPEVEKMHGYEPGTVQPTTAVVLSHKHPEDYEQVAATLDEIRRTHEPFSTRHRIIDIQGHTREVVVVAGHLRNDAGEVIGTEGFLRQRRLPVQGADVGLTARRPVNFRHD